MIKGETTYHKDSLKLISSDRCPAPVFRKEILFRSLNCCKSVLRHGTFSLAILRKYFDAYLFVSKTKTLSCAFEISQKDFWCQTRYQRLCQSRSFPCENIDFGNARYCKHLISAACGKLDVHVSSSLMLRTMFPLNRFVFFNSLKFPILRKVEGSHFMGFLAFMMFNSVTYPRDWGVTYGSVGTPMHTWKVTPYWHFSKLAESCWS